MDIYTIYKSTNKINEKSYIGFSKDFNKRINEHLKSVGKSKSAFHSAIKKYGVDNFVWEIIYQSKDYYHTKNIMEKYFIIEYNTHIDNGNGYNMTLGGDGLSYPSLKTREKIGNSSKLRTGRVCSPETRKKISIANSNRVMSEEQKQLLREINTGKKHSEETIRKKSKKYLIINPDGEKFEIYNLNRFCKENNLNQGAMAAVSRGTCKQYKCWKCYQI